MVSGAPGKPGLLFIGNFLSGNGSRAVSADLACSLAACGWQVRCVSSRRGKASRLYDMLRTILVQRRSYQVAHIDVFSGQAFLFAEFASALLRRLQKPYVLTLHGGNLPALAQRSPDRVRNLLRHANRVTTPSRYLQEQLQAFRSDIIVLPNPIHLENYPFRQRNNPAPRLVWLRAFHDIYNPTLAPEVLALLANRYPESHLVMAGPDKNDGSLQRTLALAAKLGVLDRIEFPGQVDKAAVPGWLDRGDIFLNTTNFDNTPVSVIEALACGLCVVSTYVGGMRYLLEDGCDGLLVPPGDAQSMAATVNRILTEPGLASRLSDNARLKAGVFAFSRILPLWEAMFSGIASP